MVLGFKDLTGINLTLPTFLTQGRFQRQDPPVFERIAKTLQRQMLYSAKAAGDRGGVREVKERSRGEHAVPPRPAGFLTADLSIPTLSIIYPHRPDCLFSSLGPQFPHLKQQDVDHYVIVRFSFISSGCQESGPSQHVSPAMLGAERNL